MNAKKEIEKEYQLLCKQHCDCGQPLSICPNKQALQASLERLYQLGREDRNKEIEKDIRDGWKWGDLRQGNFENFMQQVFNKSNE